MKKDDRMEDWTFEWIRDIPCNGKPINREKDIYPLLEAHLNLEKVYMGVKKGFPDYIVWRDMKGLLPPMPGFMEVKRGPADRLTRPQRIWFNNLMMSGFRCYVAFHELDTIVIMEVSRGV